MLKVLVKNCNDFWVVTPSYNTASINVVMAPSLRYSSNGPAWMHTCRLGKTWKLYVSVLPLLRSGVMPVPKEGGMSLLVILRPHLKTKQKMPLGLGRARGPEREVLGYPVHNGPVMRVLLSPRVGGI
jgi:hypothetical protein